jgi:hypothetical protein
MLRFVLGILVVLHDLVHLWYVTLSQRPVSFQPDMGWAGKSWLLVSQLGDMATRWLTNMPYALAALGFVSGSFDES